MSSRIVSISNTAKDASQMLLPPRHSVDMVASPLDTTLPNPNAAPGEWARGIFLDHSCPTRLRFRVFHESGLLDDEPRSYIDNRLAVLVAACSAMGVILHSAFRSLDPSKVLVYGKA